MVEKRNSQKIFRAKTFDTGFREKLTVVNKRTASQLVYYNIGEFLTEWD